MNPLDNLVPIDPLSLSDEQEDELQRQLRLAEIRRLQREQQQRRRRLAMQRRQRADSSSSDSEVEGPSMDPNGIAKLTPASGSTPPENEDKKDEKEKKDELVKLDPAEIGMSVGLKNLYSGKEDKRGRFQWQTEIPEVSDTKDLHVRV